MENFNEAIHVAVGEFHGKLNDLILAELKNMEYRIKDELAQSNFIPPPQPSLGGIVQATATDDDVASAPSPSAKHMSSLKVEDGGEQETGFQAEEDATSVELREDAHKEMLKKSHTYAKATRESSRAKKRRFFSSVVTEKSFESTFRTGSAKECFLTLPNSPYFDIFWALVIASNAAYLGVQLSLTQQQHLISVHIVYALLFTLELSMRMVSVGPRKYFLAPPGWGWNWLDVIVVTSSWLDIILVFIGSTGGEAVGSSFRVLRLLRVSRLLRIVKTLWIVRFVGALRTMVSSLVDTFKSLFWALLLLFLIIYIAGVLFTDMALEHLAEFDDPDNDPYMQWFFGTLGDSMQTLFRSISGGFDWAEAAEALRPLGAIWVQVFQFYIAFCTFAVLNVMTGVFCHSAIRSGEQDHLNRLDNRQEFREILQTIFERMDSSGDGLLTLSEFESIFESEAMQAFLDTAEINASDAWTLFISLDVDGDHVVDAEEFTKRCLTLRGPARSMDIFALTRHNMKIREQLKALDQKIHRLSSLTPGDDADFEI